jgi:AbrB family looped-hinge helix DNA binding protein
MESRERSTVYGLTTMDARGRMADRMIMRAVNWQPGDRLSVRLSDGLIIVMIGAGGPVVVSRQGRVHLPAAVRHAFDIKSGDQVLLAAEPADGVLVVHPLAALDAMVGRLRTQSTDGGAT